VLKGEYLLHQRLIGDGGSGCLDFGAVSGPVENIKQRPVADGWILWFE
jgi:hypothetical protein